MKNRLIVVLISIVTLAVQVELYSQQKIDLTEAEGNSASAKFVNKATSVWKNTKRTKFSYSKGHVIDDENGIYKYDTQGLVTEIILKDALPDHYKDLRKQVKNIVRTNGTILKTKRPLVPTFYDYFFKGILKDKKKLEASNKYWKVFTDIDALQKGDLIIAQYSDDWKNEFNNNSLGIMWIAWDIEKGKNDTEFIVQVFNSTTSYHTKSLDTRQNFSVPVAEKRKGKKSGIGFGKMIFKARSKEDRRVHAYKWGLKSRGWYNLTSGDDIQEKKRKLYDKLDGVIFARPIDN